MSDVNAVNKPRETDDVPVPPTLRKSLKNRHIQLIALGGAIGTGLFYGSSESIGLAGPSILLAYLIGGLAIFLIVRALSEMAVEDPKAGAFSYYATRYWSKRAGFISGWNYWFNYVLVAMVELSVVGSFVNYWFPNIPKWVSAVVFLVAIAALNLIRRIRVLVRHHQNRGRDRHDPRRPVRHHCERADRIRHPRIIRQLVHHRRRLPPARVDES